MRAPALVSACVLALLGGPGPACGATRCETPLPGGVVRSTATGLARAEEKFNEVVAGPVPAAHSARQASTKPAKHNESQVVLGQDDLRYQDETWKT